MSRSVDIAIVGSGLGGLMAGALLAKRGFSVALFERSEHFGGAASTYRRAGLTIEASLHATEDPRAPGDPNRRHLAELGILDDLPLVDVPELFEVRGGPVGAPFRLPFGFDAAKAAIADRFPDAGRGAARVLDDMARVARALDTAAGSAGAAGMLAHAPRMARDLWPIVSGWNRTLADVLTRALDGHEAAKFALAANLPYYDDNPAGLWWPYFAVAQSGYIAHGGKYLRGGSQVLADRLVEVIRANGGSAVAGRPVKDILLAADGSVRGILHAATDGGGAEEVAAPIVLANAAPTVVAGLIPEEARAGFVDAFRGRALSISLFAAHFGLARKPAEFGVGAYSTILLPDWMERLDNIADCGALMGDAPGTALPLLDMVDYSSIEAGHSAEPPYLVSVVGVDRVANWEGLDPTAYDDRRDAWLAAIEAEIDRQFPGFAGAVTSRMLATASTHARALNAPGGAVYGFAPVAPQTPIWKGFPRSCDTPIPGLLLASAYAGAGGFTGALASGGSAAERVTRTRPGD
jgi:phytoene dehydrogenase-like protein